MEAPLLRATLFLMPLVGVGVFRLLGLPSIGTGVQPADLSAGLLLAWLLLRRRARWGIDAQWLLAAFLWTALGSTLLWRLDHLGLAGELPWSKGLKQVLLLGFHAGLVLLPAAVLAVSRDREGELRGWERAASLGLLMASLYGLLQAVHYYQPLPGLDRLDAWLSSNPSIASGSHELYLGHRFVGIPRIRGPVCEPLYFGSFLLAVVPVTGAAAFQRRGTARAWRGLAAGAGTLCLLLSFSRGAYLGAFVLSATLLVGMARGRLLRPSRRAMGLGLGVGGTGLLLGASLLTGRPPWALPALVGERLLQSFADHDMSNLTRFYGWRAALAAFLQQPVTGVGWGGFGFLYYGLAPAGGAGAHFGWPVTNSLPLLLLAETGLVGALLWGRAALASLVALGRRPASCREDRRAFLLAAVCLGLLAQTLTFSQWNLPHLWLAFGVAAALGRAPGRLV